MDAASLALQVLAAMDRGVMVTDADDRVLMANPACLRMAGLPAGTRATRPADCGLLGLDVMLDAPDPRVARAGLPWRGETVQYRPDGGELTCAMSVDVLTLPDGRAGLLRVWSDISPRKRAQERLETLALHDALTGLPNRAHLESRLAHAIERARRSGQRFALVFLDLDGFKQVNDRLGHAAGDELLRDVALRLAAALRESDTVARLGGDEFVLLLEDLADPMDVQPSCERVLQTLRDTRIAADASLRISGSLGVSLYPDDGLTARQLLEHADIGMYHVKQAGRDGWRFFARRPEAAGPSGSAMPRFDGLDCLVADDVRINRAALAGMLRKLGCRVREAADGAQARVAIAERMPAVAFLDEDMPQARGSQVARELTTPGDAPRAFVALYTADESIRAGLPGVDAVLPKPADTQALVALLTRARQRQDTTAA